MHLVIRSLTFLCQPNDDWSKFLSLAKKNYLGAFRSAHSNDDQFNQFLINLEYKSALIMCEWKLIPTQTYYFLIKNDKYF